MKRFHRSGWLMFAALLALAGAMWPQVSYAAGCSALEPQPCWDQMVYDGWISVMEVGWWLNKVLILLPARWLEGLREFLMEDVFGSIFDVTMIGIQAPFWTIAAIALCVFATCSFLIGLVQVQWVRPRAVFGYSLLAMLLFSIGSPAIVATENVRMAVAQGFSQIAQQGVEDAGGAINFYVDEPEDLGSVRSIYDGDADCSGASTKRSVSGIYLNDYVALYLRANATDIHCSTLSLPVQFKEHYANENRIDQNEQEDREKAIALAQDGAMRMLLAVPMGTGVLLEQGVHLLFTVCVGTIWFGLLISLLFALFTSTEGMFKTQIHAGVQVFKTSWIASLWMGIALAIVKQAADTGSGAALYGATIVATLMISWQMLAAGKLLGSTLFTVADGVTGGGASALKNLASSALQVGTSVATGGAGPLLSGLLGNGRKKGEERPEDATDPVPSTALTRPIRQRGQLAQATGQESQYAPQELTYGSGTVEGGSYAWAQMRRQRTDSSGRQFEERAAVGVFVSSPSGHAVQGMPNDAAATTSSSAPANSQAASLPAPSSSPQRTSQASHTPPKPPKAVQPIRSRLAGDLQTTDQQAGSQKAQTQQAGKQQANQQLSPEIIAMAEDLNRPPENAQERARRVGAASLQLKNAPPHEQQAIRQEVEQQAQSYYTERGTLPPTDPAIPMRLRVSKNGVVRATLADESAAPSAMASNGVISDPRRERVAFGTARPSAERVTTLGTARATNETGQATGQRGYRTATTSDGQSRALVRTRSAVTSHTEAVVIAQSVPSGQAAPASAQTASASSGQAPASAAPASSQAAPVAQVGAQQPTAAPKVVVSTAVPSATTQPQSASTPTAPTPISGQRASSQASNGAAVASHIDASTLAALVELPHSATSATVADLPVTAAPAQGVEQPAQASTPQESPIDSAASIPPVVIAQAAPQVQQAPAPTQHVEPAPVQPLQPSASQAALPHAPVSSQASSVAPIAYEPMVFEPNQQPAEQGAEQPTEQPSRRSKPWARHAQARQSEQHRSDQPQQTVEHKQSRAALPRASDRRKS
jgi:hypothetical protein